MSIYNIQKINKDKNKQSYVSVTSITGLLEKPYLKFWAVDLAIQYIGDNAEKDSENIYYVSENTLQEAKTRHTQRLNETADIGSELHKLIEIFINIKLKQDQWDLMGFEDYINNKQNYNLKQMFDQFYIWQRDNVKQFLESERFVVHQDLCYAGALDFIWKGHDDKIYCTDLKTSNSIYKDHELQCSAYKQARESMEGEYKIYCQYGNENWIKVYNYDKIKIDEVSILNIERDFFNMEHKIIKDVDNLQVAFNYLVGFYYAFAKRRLNNKRAISRN